MLVALLLFGCDAELRDKPRIIGRQDFLQPAFKPTKHTAESSMIKSIVLGRGRDVTLLIATIHGNEKAGTPLLKKMAEHLRADPQLLIGRKVVLVPVANPYGALRNSRYNANGVDLNRNFKTNNRLNNKKNGYTGLSEPESRELSGLIDFHKPHRVVTIHQPLNCIDYDGPGKAIAEKMAQHCNLPVKKLGARSGSLGSYVGSTLNKPIITVELPRNADKLSAHELWQKYGKMLMASVTYSPIESD
jgi:murein peptide amidase A